MQISLEQLLRGQHFYTGLRIATGLLTLAIGVYFIAGLTVAATVTAGAICTSVVDTPSPFRHKTRELLAAWALSSGIYFLIGFLRPMPELLSIGIVALSFIIALSTAYGNKAIAVGFAGSFAIVVGLGARQYAGLDLLDHTLFFVAGGSAYMIYGLVTSHFLVFRTKQQVFAESSFELAQYLRIKSTFYEEGAQLDALYAAMVRQQSVVVQKQQIARNFLFRDIKSDRDLRIAQLFIMQVDFFEYILASNTDYEMLQKYYSGSDIMLFLRDLVYKTAKGIDNIAFTSLRNAEAHKRVKYKAEIFAIEHDLERLSHDKSQDMAALTILIDAFDKVILCTEKVEAIQRVQMSPNYVPDTAVSIKLSLFTTISNYSPRVLIENLSLNSLYFRYAIRVSVAMACALLLASFLNNYVPGTSSRSYWILLTISVVLRPNFSLTVQRRTDRIIGSAAGSLLTAVLLYFSPPVLLLVFCLYLAQIAVNTFVTLNYRYAAAAGSMLALIQIHFMNPATTFAFGERTIDTILGALLAYVCCYIFPSWEYRSIPQLIQVLSQATAKYTRLVLSCSTMDEEYRLARKHSLDSMAELSGAFDRMLREPKAKRRAVVETGRFITLNYLFGARIASIKTLLIRLGKCPDQLPSSLHLEEVSDKLEQLISMTHDSRKQAGAQGMDDMREATAGTLNLAELINDSATSDTAKPEAAANSLQNMDYSEQHVIMLLQKQLDSALTLASEIETFKRDFEIDYKKWLRQA